MTAVLADRQDVPHAICPTIVHKLGFTQCLTTTTKCGLSGLDSVGNPSVGNNLILTFEAERKVSFVSARDIFMQNTCVHTLFWIVVVRDKGPC